MCLSFIVNMRLCLFCVDGVPRYGCHGALPDNAVFNHSCILLKVKCTILDAEEVWNTHDFCMSATEQGVCSFRRYMLSFKYQNDVILEFIWGHLSLCVCFFFF